MPIFPEHDDTFFDVFLVQTFNSRIRIRLVLHEKYVLRSSDVEQRHQMKNKKEHLLGFTGKEQRRLGSWLLLSRKLGHRPCFAGICQRLTIQLEACSVT